MIRTLVVDDSAFMRKVVSDILSKDPRFTVIGTARNGRDALSKVKMLKPDLLTMDVEMPEMGGLEALRELMAEHPLPVIMLSSVTKQGTEQTITAMELGAVDFVAKPSGSISLDMDKIAGELVEKAAAAAKAGINKKPVPEAAPNETVTAPEDSGSGRIVVLGTSTGGPKALQQFLTRLPSNFPRPIFIVQHMPAGFTKSLSTRLHQLSEISVKEAEHGEIAKKGVAYIAPGGYHLTIRKIGTSVAIQLEQGELVNGHRPSVDPLFQSAYHAGFKGTVGIIMTGMGSDGKEGARLLKQEKGTILLAETESSCVVYGMPRAVMEAGLVDDTASAGRMAELLMKYC
ncbi:protein-glutamate methylesterase/protein-glutamine glutaminase [Alkalicoccus urumqiensis]|uniref:Protein-glutamate methylesterase/protein-glutamine glutaminase n=1 Tax=Alkalicoccus urumqiensis TaxID=1548213 RepID=A0A2P6MG18_ALKUR|nr:chemotaxis response regulator protein-glutamate methylesterase [Alkalicoccus urumqiensis]PRO65211.1 chemotaxis response regulator protein-glutamate methylesterase [Alkalicoccus urumqiensis]